MTRPSAEKPAKTPARPDRAQREAAALRANLLKRKDQARQREQAKPKPDRKLDAQANCRLRTRGIALDSEG